MLQVVPVSRRIQSGLLLIAAACLLLGCSKSDPPTEVGMNESTTQSSTSADSVAAAMPEQQLSGVWLGSAVMDEAKFEQKISELNPEQQQLLIAKAGSFLSMVMAVEFRNDGVMENGVEMVSTDGQLLRDNSVGKWKIISAENNDLLVETQETLSDGTVATDQTVYKFFPDGNRFAMSVPASEELQGCNPMLVFQRESVQNTNLAEGLTDTLAK